MKKSEARIIYKQQRQSLSLKALNVMQDLLLIQFQQMVLPYTQIVHAYIPKASSNEPDPGPMVDWMKFRDLGLQVSYAKIDPSDMSMHHFMQHEEMVFEENQFGILEPQTGHEISPDLIDIAFVPLLAFDEHGDRVGYGKGYYDRFLTNCREDMVKIGLSFFPPVPKIEDVDFFDKKLDFCITPECVYAF